MSLYGRGLPGETDKRAKAVPHRCFLRFSASGAYRFGYQGIVNVDVGLHSGSRTYVRPCGSVHISVVLPDFWDCLDVVAVRIGRGWGGAAS